MSLNGSLSRYDIEPTSNRLTGITNPSRQFSFDNAGNTVVDSASYQATYDLRGQMTSLTKGGVTTRYDYNAAGQRIRKYGTSGTSSTVVFIYDPDGHLLGEYDAAGSPIREYVWLRDMPIAMFMPDPANPAGAPLVYFIHTDHLDAPRVVMDMNGMIRWQWISEPFGTTAPEVDPSGLGAFTFNLRFPGQYADQESGLWYNHFRHYEKDSGRYTQSDPIGLAGGGMSTYTYVDGDPLSNIDPRGLANGSAAQQWMRTPRDAVADGDFLACYSTCVSALHTTDAWSAAIGANAINAAPYEVVPIFDYDTGNLRGYERQQSDAFRYMKQRYPGVATRLLGASRGSAYAAAACVGWTVGTSYGCMASCGIDPTNY